MLVILEFVEYTGIMDHHTLTRKTGHTLTGSHRPVVYHWSGKGSRKGTSQLTASSVQVGSLKAKKQQLVGMEYELLMVPKLLLPLPVCVCARL